MGKSSQSIHRVRLRSKQNNHVYGSTNKSNPVCSKKKTITCTVRGREEATCFGLGFYADDDKANLPDGIHYQRMPTPPYFFLYSRLLQARQSQRTTDVLLMPFARGARRRGHHPSPLWSDGITAARPARSSQSDSTHPRCIFRTVGFTMKIKR